MNPIVIPGLGLELNIQRVAFSLFGKDVYWYGVIIAVGFLVAVTYCYFQAHLHGIPRDRVLDFILFAAPGGIIGARIYYVLFYPSLYRSADGSFNWRAAIAIWDGGLAIYGGIIASVLILFLFCKATRLKFTAFADLGCCGLFIGQAIGRWGNFCNQEAFGCETTLPWRMGLTVWGTYMEVHPTFLYESIWNLVGLAIVHFWLRKRRRFDGEVFLFYLAWYGLGRVWIEGLRTDSLYLFGTGIRVSQLLAGLCLVLAGSALLVIRLKVRPDPQKMYVYQTDQTALQSQSAAGETVSVDTEEPMAAPESNEEVTQDGSSDH